MNHQACSQSPGNRLIFIGLVCTLYLHKEGKKRRGLSQEKEGREPKFEEKDEKAWEKKRFITVEDERIALRPKGIRRVSRYQKKAEAEE